MQMRLCLNSYLPPKFDFLISLRLIFYYNLSHLNYGYNILLVSKSTSSHIHHSIYQQILSVKEFKISVPYLPSCSRISLCDYVSVYMKCVHTTVCCVVCIGQRITYWGQFSPSTTCLLRTDLRSPSLAANAPSHQPIIALILIPFMIPANNLFTKVRSESRIGCKSR